MSLSLSEIARLVDGRLTGDGDISISGAATLAVAEPGEITLADHSKLAAQLTRCQAAAVIVPAGFEPFDRPYITVSDVHAAFTKVVRHFHPPRQCSLPGISPAAWVSPRAKLGPDVHVFPQAFIGEDVTIGAGSIIHSGVRILDGCQIGAGCTLFPNAVLYENSVLGDRVMIHAGAVIGAYGFGYSQAAGRHKLSAQLGNVRIGNDVEIGAAAAVDRGTYGPTVIGEGTKIDNLVQIGHNCRIGRHNLICSQVGIAGSASTGDYVVMGGQVGVADHLHLGEKSVIGAKGGVMTDTEPGKRYVGLPAIEERQAFRSVSAVQHLPAMKKQLQQLERTVGQLTANVTAAASERTVDAA